MKTQNNIITAELFNLLYPVGSSVWAHVHPGLRQCKILSPAEHISEHEVAFKANYDLVHSAMVSLAWLDAAHVVDDFNDRFTEGCWLYCEKKGETYALQVERGATYSQSGNFFMAGGEQHSIARVMGLVKWIIEFKDEGQDFTKWFVNENNVVVDSKPLHASLWSGHTIDMERLANGWVAGKDAEGNDYSIRYPVRNLILCPHRMEVQHG
ncbi:MAG: hypothetical protein F9K23_00855 [Bacteroidetes bacterium]|nr:MAG: hypothetical protein F9K23_00855 [Bacteroidota bacterium]